MDCPKCQTTIMDHEIDAEIPTADAIMIVIQCGSCGTKLFTIVSPDDFTILSE